MNKRKFFKVYSGPGYPIDPKADAVRAIDHFVNDVPRAFEFIDELQKQMPRAPRTFNHDLLNNWLLSRLN